MAKTSSKPKAEYAIQTVANALRMLEVFHTETEMGVSDLARRLKLHKNNAFRLLATLELLLHLAQLVHALGEGGHIGITLSGLRQLFGVEPK